MAVDNASQIDAIANDKENACLVLLITDHLNWDNEFEHLKILQDKINAYLKTLSLCKKLEKERGRLKCHFLQQQ